MKIRMENDRLLIRGLKDGDLEGLTALRSEERVYRFEPAFLAERQGSPEEALRTIQGMDLETDRQCILGIFEKTDPDVLAGLAELYDYKPSGRVISLGYRLRPAFWGRGIATGCVQVCLKYLRSHTRVEMVTAHVIPENRGSSRCLLKNGFVHLVTKTEDWGLDQPMEAEVYALDIEPEDSCGRMGRRGCL